MKDFGAILAERRDDPSFNTSYPLSPGDWAAYRVDGGLPFGDYRRMSFYVHVPFCRRLCSFCEYTRTLCPEDTVQNAYVDGLASDVASFIRSHPGIVLDGFDIGGGTPTSLCPSAFAGLMDVYRMAVGECSLADGFEPSIEGTIETATADKLRMIAETGIGRISVGVQSTDRRVLEMGNRAGESADALAAFVRNAHSAGIAKVNIDLMYGLRGQTADSVREDLGRILAVRPEQVTLYEQRGNMTGASVPDHGTLTEFYGIMFSGLTAAGYHGEYGRNTFSLDPDDFGLSSYLRGRMFGFVPYKGFGISAQSMSPSGISYNMGKGRADIRPLLAAGSYPEEYTYVLPPNEMLAKYVSVSGYAGRFSGKVADRILGEEFAMKYADELEYCILAWLMEKRGEWYCLTHEGFKYYGAVLSLFGKKC